MRLLFAEDDPMIGAGVRQGLAQDGFAVDWVRDGAAAERALAENVHELVLLDLGLPRKDGLDVLASMRRRGDARPVLVLTARDALADRVAGLDAGADDYLTKPFELAELAARLRALARRASGRAAPTIELRRRERSIRRRARCASTARRSRCPRASTRCSRRFARAARRDPVARAARGAPLRLEGRGREQRGRGAPVAPAPQAARRASSATCAGLGWMIAPRKASA